MANLIAKSLDKPLSELVSEFSGNIDIKNMTNLGFNNENFVVQPVNEKLIESQLKLSEQILLLMNN